ncbi:MAG: cell division protein FtsA [Chloroflexi bacterium]|nr:cell division protein FtsA [Chloroflexota bacterium]
MKKRILTGIDVGTTKICTAIAEMNEENALRVIGIGIVPSHGLHKGLVVNINEARESIRESVRKAEQSSGQRVDSAYVGVTGRHVTSLNNRGVVSITRNDRMVRHDDLRRVLQSAQSVKVTSDRKLLHVIPRHYALDGQETVQNPLGMHGSRLDVETHVITAAVASVQNLIKCVRSADIDIEDLVLEPLASSEAVLTEEEKQAGVILADIGGGTTDIAIFKDGSIWHTAILPVAGYQLTRDIAVGLGLPFNIAEDLKKRYGSVMPVYEGGMTPDSPVAENGHKTSYQDLCDVLHARVEEMIRLIMLELPRSEYKALVPAGLVLTGGSSNLSGMDKLARDMLRLPVRIGSPTTMAGIGDNLCDPAYATGVGLLLWGAKQSTSVTRRARGLGGLWRMVFQLRRLFRS